MNDIIVDTDWYYEKNKFAQKIAKFYEEGEQGDTIKLSFEGGEDSLSADVTAENDKDNNMIIFTISDHGEDTDKFSMQVWVSVNEKVMNPPLLNGGMDDDNGGGNRDVDQYFDHIDGREITYHVTNVITGYDAALARTADE